MRAQLKQSQWTLFAVMLAAFSLPVVSFAQTASASPSSWTAFSWVNELSISPLARSLKQWIGLEAAEKPLLPPEAAFKLSVIAKQPDMLVAKLVAADDYYLYRDRIAFRIEQPSGVSIKNIALPSGNSKQDPTFGTMDVYYGTVRINIFLDPATVKRGIAVKLHVTYQGCNDSKGVCYPPVETEVAPVF